VNDGSRTHGFCAPENDLLSSTEIGVWGVLILDTHRVGIPLFGWQMVQVFDLVKRPGLRAFRVLLEGCARAGAGKLAKKALSKMCVLAHHCPPACVLFFRQY
jgi:hypothetical protein